MTFFLCKICGKRKPVEGRKSLTRGRLAQKGWACKECSGEGQRV